MKTFNYTAKLATDIPVTGTLMADTLDEAMKLTRRIHPDAEWIDTRAVNA